MEAGANASEYPAIEPLRIFILRKVSGDAVITDLLILPPQYNLANLIVLVPAGKIRLAEDEFVVANAIKWLHSHRDVDVVVAVNLSGQSLGDFAFLDFVTKELEFSNIDNAKLCFEITETMAVRNLDFAVTFINQLRGLGCKFSLDDFGSGMSSYGYLKNLHVDYLKIDGSFIKNICTNATDELIVESINGLGHKLGMQTTAEFVETQEILDKVIKIGIDYSQGYLHHKPSKLSEFK